MRRIVPVLLLLCAALLSAGCTSGSGSLKNSPSYRNRRAQSLLERSKSELEQSEFSAALADIVHAETLCEDEALLADIYMHREYMINHMHLRADVEERSTLLYTLLYKRGEVYQPVDNLNIRFSFVKGSGIMNESARTDANGAARCEVEKVYGMRSKFIVESVPEVIIDSVPVQIQELRYNFVVANRGDGESPRLDHITDIVAEAIENSVELIDDIFEDVWGD
jgi:hypothetical protein